MSRKVGSTRGAGRGQMSGTPQGLLEEAEGRVPEHFVLRELVEHPQDRDLVGQEGREVQGNWGSSGSDSDQVSRMQPSSLKVVCIKST